MIFDQKNLKEITSGTIVSMGVRKVRLTLLSGKEVYATCDRDIIQELDVGSSVVIGFLTSGGEAYVIKKSSSPLGGQEQSVTTI